MNILGMVLYIVLFFGLPIAYLFFKFVGNSLEEDLVRKVDRYYRHKELERNSNKHRK